MSSSFLDYEPLNTLKPVADNIWIVDGPEIRFGYLGFQIPFPTRMTIVRLAEGGLFVHSPIAPQPALMKSVDALGPVAHIVAPNTIHYWWVPDWKALYPNAKVHAVPGLAEAAKRLVTIDDILEDAPPADWSDEIDQAMFAGDAITEAVFFHRASRTAILTDLIENFELPRIRWRPYRWLIKWAGAADPKGSAPYDMRLTYLRHRKAMRAGVRRMFGWRAERVILAHGRWYPNGGDAELRRAFAWIGALR